MLTAIGAATGINVLNGDGDGISTGVVVAIVVAVAASPFVLGLVLRLLDRRRGDADPAGSSETRPPRARTWGSMSPATKAATMVAAAVAGYLLAVLID